MYKGPHITTYISQALHITYISQQTSQSLYITIYISQLATNNFKHIQKSNAKSCKFTTYPEVHKSINIEINKFMAAVGRRTVVGRRTEVGTTAVGASLRCPATSLAYSMPPIDSAKNVGQ